MDTRNIDAETPPVSAYQTVLIERDEGIAWVTLNRPDKRNAMSPTLNREMLEVLEELEVDDGVGVVVLTGAGDSFTAGMDLKEYFRETDNASAAVKLRTRRAAGDWQWRKLRTYAKPTIAMVNGWCFGGGFTPLVACDLAIAADEASLGLSEINWGIIPAGNVTRAVAEAMPHRAALCYIMTGETFGGQVAREVGLVNESVPRERLRERTRELAMVLLGKNPTVLRQAKNAFKRIGGCCQSNGNLSPPGVVRAGALVLRPRGTATRPARRSGSACRSLDW